MFHILGCISNDHDPRLVAIAALLCVFANWTAVTLLSRAFVADRKAKRRWIAAAALIFGAGIWATHFVAMLGYQSDFPISYDLAWTSASIAVAIAFSGAAFWLMVQPGRTLVGGAVLGLGISAMHYTGMKGLRGDFDLVWDLHYVLASVAAGIALGIAAALTLRRSRGIAGQVAATLLLTLSICAMHFAGMSSLMLVPNLGLEYHGFVMAPDALATAVTAVAVLIVALGQVGALLDRHLAGQRSSEAVRQENYIAELEATKRQLAGALHDAHAANEAKSVFLATMSHELRTPLNAIIGFAELMKTGLFGPLGHSRYTEYAGDIHGSGLHLLSLINDVLDLSRLDAGKAELRETNFLLEQLIQETCRGLQPLARRDGLTLHVELAPDLPGLRADPRRIKQVILNLVSNAIKFTPEGGKVTVRAWEQDGSLNMQVGDTGIGIAKADLPRALERFGQVDSSLSRKYDGTGLGLPLTKHLVELHDGIFALQSEVGVGTSVTITFPPERLVRHLIVPHAQTIGPCADSLDPAIAM